MKFKLVHLELVEANELVARWHRHHKPIQGHRFSIGAIDIAKDMLIGAAIVGRPVARKTDHKVVAEVTRLVTDGTPHACSFLYGAAARAAKALGFGKIQTFILDAETGVSLKASGWILADAHAGGGNWNSSTKQNRRTDQPMCLKQRWEKDLGVI